MSHATGAASQRHIRVPVPGGELGGDIVLPEGALGIVLFAHGSGSSRLSPRNQWVARHLEAANLGTFLFDLLTEAEEAVDARTGTLRFNIPFLAERLVHVTDLVRGDVVGPDARLGYFGASTGAAAALMAAAERPAGVHAVVSRGGRPDLAGPSLARVRAPTLLVVGGADREVLALNTAALSQLTCPKALRVVPRATHLFEEPGALEEVASLARDWFSDHLAALHA
jgi:alpha-beta hydrolase superfamily lysophospholipase